MSVFVAEDGLGKVKESVLDHLCFFIIGKLELTAVNTLTGY